MTKGIPTSKHRRELLIAQVRKELAAHKDSAELLLSTNVDLIAILGYVTEKTVKRMLKQGLMTEERQYRIKELLKQGGKQGYEHGLANITSDALKKQGENGYKNGVGAEPFSKRSSYGKAGANMRWSNYQQKP